LFYLLIGLLLKDILPDTKVYVLQCDVQMLIKMDSDTLKKDMSTCFQLLSETLLEETHKNY